MRYTTKVVETWQHFDLHKQIISNFGLHPIGRLFIPALRAQFRPSTRLSGFKIPNKKPPLFMEGVFMCPLGTDKESDDDLLSQAQCLLSLARERFTVLF
ncbi:MAG TPA: hypothetical protein VK910_09605, partial [Thiobacillus sp.]|nr:hypothetical protein [Thiobacillus sp.]